MGEVFYSSMKFKKNLRQGTAATQDEDVTYSEVKIINPTTSNTVCHCGSAGHSGQSSHPYRRAAVCPGLLCALLLAATLVLCVLYTSQSGKYSMLETELKKLRSNCSTTNKEKVHQQKNYSMLERELEELRTSCNTMKVQQQSKYSILEREMEELRTSYNTMNKEKVQQQEKYSMLEKELEELRTSCSTMNKEKVQQQEKYSMLERELEELRSSCSTMNEEKVQQQTNYNAILKKLPFLELYCPSSSQSRVCEPCPQGWSQFSSKCYYFSNEKKNWFDSRSDCIKRGADLVIIESGEEQGFITSKTQFHIWIGLSHSECEGNWLWVDGTPLQKEFWGSGKPADKTRCHCALIATKTKAWEDYFCSNNEHWVCATNALLP